MKSVTKKISPSRKLLLMVAELHGLGYQRLRIAPYIGGPGYWRCLFAPVTHILAQHGARLMQTDEWHRYAPYTSAAGNDYWEWVDEHDCTPFQLAKVFLDRWEEIAAEGYGQDWLYAGWYQHMLHVTYPDHLPIAFDDYEAPKEFLMSTREGERIPLPPPGLATTQ